MTQTPLSQDTAATKEVAAGLREAGPLIRSSVRLPLLPDATPRPHGRGVLVFGVLGTMPFAIGNR
jgi:hypothetical protein